MDGGLWWDDSGTLTFGVLTGNSPKDSQHIEHLEARPAGECSLPVTVKHFVSLSRGSSSSLNLEAQVWQVGRTSGTHAVWVERHL